MADQTAQENGWATAFQGATFQPVPPSYETWLRDQFAMHASDATVARYMEEYEVLDPTATDLSGRLRPSTTRRKRTATEARYAFADEMMQERKEGQS